MKILTYNIHKGMDKNNVPTLFTICRFIKSLNCDIICLQEVLYPQFLILKNVLKMKGTFATHVKKIGFTYGICTLTKHKNFTSEHILLTSKKEQRGLLCLNIKIKDGEYLNVINTHLGLDKIERNEQIDEILDYSGKVIGDKIICGDFNAQNINLDPFLDAATTFNKQNKPTFWPTNARIDYIFLDSGFKLNKYTVYEQKLSDHYPVFINII